MVRGEFGQDGRDGAKSGEREAARTALARIDALTRAALRGDGRGPAWPAWVSREVELVYEEVAPWVRQVKSSGPVHQVVLWLVKFSGEPTLGTLVAELAPDLVNMMRSKQAVQVVEGLLGAAGSAEHAPTLQAAVSGSVVRLLNHPVGHRPLSMLYAMACPAAQALLRQELYGPFFTRNKDHLVDELKQAFLRYPEKVEEMLQSTKENLHAILDRNISVGCGLVHAVLLDWLWESDPRDHGQLLAKLRVQSPGKLVRSDKGQLVLLHMLEGVGAAVKREVLVKLQPVLKELVDRRLFLVGLVASVADPGLAQQLILQPLVEGSLVDTLPLLHFLASGGSEPELPTADLYELVWAHKVRGYCAREAEPLLRVVEAVVTQAVEREPRRWLSEPEPAKLAELLLRRAHNHWLPPPNYLPVHPDSPQSSLTNVLASALQPQSQSQPNTTLLRTLLEFVSPTELELLQSRRIPPSSAQSE